MANPKKKRRGQMMSALAVTVLLVVYYLLFSIMCACLPELPKLVRVIFGVIPLIFAGVCVCVCAQRMREIKKGESDDLSQY